MQLDVQKTVASLGLVACAMLAGVTAGLELSLSAYRLLDLGLLAACFGFIFWWVHADADQIRFKRSKALNAGILVLPLFFFPVYLARSRKDGERAPAFLKVVAFLVVLAALGVASEFAVAFLSV